VSLFICLGQIAHVLMVQYQYYISWNCL